MSDAALSIRGLRKAYASGTEALKAVDLDIAHGEIFALLGPNGAGKTTLISIVCGLVTASSGEVLVAPPHLVPGLEAEQADSQPTHRADPRPASA